MNLFNFFNKHKNYILFDKNLIISGIFAFFAGAIFTQLYSEYDQNNFRNSFITLIIEYEVYIPLFVILYYFENKTKYLDNLTNKRNYTLIKKDIIKLLTASGIYQSMPEYIKNVGKGIHIFYIDNLSLKLNSSSMNRIFYGNA